MKNKLYAVDNDLLEIFHEGVFTGSSEVVSEDDIHRLKVMDFSDDDFDDSDDDFEDDYDDDDFDDDDFDDDDFDDDDFDDDEFDDDEDE